MNFLAPLAFWLSLLLPVIVLMYLLKRQRTDHLISSIYLWRQMVRDVEANSPWQKLRRNLLLLLQLLFLSALIFTLARPATPTNQPGARVVIFVLDASASMSAVDAVPSRLEAAKEQTRQFISNLPQETSITLISAGSKTRVLAANTKDRLLVIKALDSIQATAGDSDMATALQIASATASRQPDSQIVILSDGNVRLPERPLQAGQILYYPIGTRSENQAINLLNLEIAPGGKSLTAFAQIVNYSDQPVKRRASLLADGALASAYDLEIPPGGDQIIIAQNILTTTRMVELVLLPDPDTPDYLTVDDRAIAVSPSPRNIRINMVSSGNLFLDTAVQLLPGTQVTRFDPTVTDSLPAADLTIMDATLPFTKSQDLPSGSLLFISPPRSSELFTVQGLVSRPTPQAATDNDPLLANVSLDSVHILDAVWLSVSPWAVSPIIATNPSGEVTYPLLVYGQTGGRRVAILAFDLRHSDLPLQIAFPILFSNIFAWLVNDVGGNVPSQVVPGQALVLTRPYTLDSSSGLQVRITHPDGSITRLDAANGQIIFDDTNQPGLYRIDWGAETSSHFAVNLFSPQESSIKPVGTLNLASVSTRVGMEASISYREWWRWAALLALVILCIEWLVYHRPTVVRLYRKYWPQKEQTYEL